MSEGSNVASMVQRFRSSAPTSRSAREAARDRGEVQQLWFASDKEVRRPPDDDDDAILDEIEGKLGGGGGGRGRAPPNDRFASSVDEIIAAEISKNLSLGPSGPSRSRPSSSLSPSRAPPGGARSPPSPRSPSPPPSSFPPRYNSPSAGALAGVKTLPPVPRFRFVPGGGPPSSRRAQSYPPPGSPGAGSDSSDDTFDDDYEDRRGKPLRVTGSSSAFTNAFYGEDVERGGLPTFRGERVPLNASYGNRGGGNNSSSGNGSGTGGGKKKEKKKKGDNARRSKGLDGNDDVESLRGGSGSDGGSGDEAGGAPKVKFSWKRNNMNNMTSQMITSELTGLCENMMVKLESNGGAPGGLGKFNPAAFEEVDFGELPYTIKQVTQNLENNLYTFNKIWVTDVAEKEKEDARSEAAKNPKKKDPKNKKNRLTNFSDSDSDQDVPQLHSPRQIGKDDADSHLLAPLANALAEEGEIRSSPRARARKLLQAIGGGERYRYDGEDGEGRRFREGGEEGEEEEEEEESTLYDDADERSEADGEAANLVLAKHPSAMAHADAVSGGAATRGDSGDFVRYSGPLVNRSAQPPRDTSKIFDGRKIFDGGSPKKYSTGIAGAYYGASTLHTTSDDIVSTLEITIKCMQKRLNYEPVEDEKDGGAMLLKDDPDSKLPEGQTLSDKEREEEKLMKILEDAGDRSEFDEESVERGGGGSPRGGRRDARGEDEDSLGSDDFGATPFGWVPSGTYSLQGLPPFVEHNRSDPRDSRERQLAAAPSDYPGVPVFEPTAPTTSAAAVGGGAAGGATVPSAPPKSPRSPRAGGTDYNNGSRSPRLISTDEVFSRYRTSSPRGNGDRGDYYYDRRERSSSPRIVTSDNVYHRRSRPSVHEDQNVATPLVYVSSSRGRQVQTEGLPRANTEVHSWSYVPTHSSAWELKTHPSEQRPPQDRYGDENRKPFVNDIHSFPSTALDNGYRGEKSEKWAGSAIKTARKRLDDFKAYRGAVTSGAPAKAFGSGGRRGPGRGEFEYGGISSTDVPRKGERDDRDWKSGPPSPTKSKSGSKGEVDNTAKGRLEAFKRLREERAKVLSHN